MNTHSSLAANLQIDDLNYFLRGKDHAVFKSASSNRFYVSVLSTWSNLRCFEPEGELAIRTEPIWANSRIDWDISPNQRQLWKRAGVRFVGDVCHKHEGRLLSHTEINSKFNLKSSFLDALALHLSITLSWRTALSDGWQEPNGPTPGIQIKSKDNDPISITNLTSKRAYEYLMGKNSISNAAYKRWHEEEQTCLRAFASIRETKILSFQYKLINRIIPCRTYLKQIRIFDTDECPFCQGLDSLQHFFHDCTPTQRFWEGLQRWTNQVEDLRLDTLTNKEILLGIPFPLAKYYIHRQKLFFRGDLSYYNGYRNSNQGCVQRNGFSTDWVHLRNSRNGLNT